MTALIAQESTFTAMCALANAYGLMQLLPSTGRRYAQRLGDPAIFTGVADTARNQHPPRDGPFQGSDRPLRRRALRPREL
jgi:hypothetical protein